MTETFARTVSEQKYFEIPVCEIRQQGQNPVYVPIYKFSQEEGALRLMLLPHGSLSDAMVKGIYFNPAGALEGRGIFVIPSKKVEELEEAIKYVIGCAWYLYLADQFTYAQHAAVVHADMEMLEDDNYAQLYSESENGCATLAFDYSGNLYLVDQNGGQHPYRSAHPERYFMTAGVIAA